MLKYIASLATHSLLFSSYQQAYQFRSFWNSSPGERHSLEAFRAKISMYARLIQSEIPEGSSVSKVETFLDTHKIEHSAYSKDSITVKDNSTFENLDFPNKHQIIKGAIYAAIRKEGQHLGDLGVYMIFFFMEMVN